MCVVYTHTSAGIAVSAMKDGLLPLSQHAQKFHGRIGYHSYEGIFHSFESDAGHYQMVWDAALQLIEGGASDYRG